MRDEAGGVPRPWRVLLGWAMPRELRDAVLGDAAEEFHRRVAREGRSSATRWYRRQALRSVLPAAVHRARLLAPQWRPHNGEGDGMRGWWSDLTLALRTLLKRPGFALTVVVTLGVGIGANTALFGVFRAVFLKPLPLPEADRLVLVMEAGSSGCCGPASGPDYLDWRERNRSFEDVGAMSPATFTLTGLSEAEKVYGNSVTASIFELLGVDPLMGRVLLPEDQSASGVVVLSYGMWQRVFGGSPEVLGTTLDIDYMPYTVVGVMPRGFDVPSPWAGTRSHELFVPLTDERLAESRQWHNMPVVGRLRPGATLETAQADMERIMAELAAEYPATNATRTARVFTVHEYLFGNVGKQLGIVLGAALLVLLIACGNVAGLQLARSAGREGELSVRTALGASRGAMIRLLFSESLLMAAAGGVLGVVVSWVAVDGLRAVLPPTMPRVDGLRIDGWALLFALGASVFTAVAFGVLPALLSSRTNLAAGLREGGRGTLAPVKERVRDAFIVGQVALGLVLANGAALLVRSYAQVRGQEYGFEAEGVLTMRLVPAGARYEDERALLNYYDDVARKVAAVPGVVGLGTVSRLPLFGGSNAHAWVEGQPPRQSAGEGPLVEITSVTGDYFQVMGVPLLRGRLLEAGDSATAATGVVINEAFADKAWPGDDPLGKRVSFDDNPPDWLTVVGVVGNVRQWGPERPVQAQIYFPLARGGSSASYLTVKVTGDPAQAADGVRRALLEVDPAQPPSEVSTMSDRMERTFAQRRFYTTLIGLFAVAALFLAAAGVYGTVSYFVARRIREMGIRMALGSAAGDIVGLVVARGFRLAVLGVVLGLGGVWASTSVVSGLVYGIAPVSVVTLAGGSVVLGAVAVLASLLPALRAVRVSPVMALRSE